MNRPLQRLHHDSSPRAQLLASLTYNMIVEGTLAETGYEAYHRMLTEQDMLPGLREGIGYSSGMNPPIAFGLYLIERLLRPTRSFGMSSKPKPAALPEYGP